MNPPCPIIRPRYYVAQLADAMKGDWRGYHLSQKMDGIWQVRQFNGSTITGERMRDGSFYAFDVVQVQGDDVRRCQWRDRREALIELAQHFPAGWQIAPEGHGAEFIEAVLANGGEGVVAKNFESYFGVGWHKIKRQETFDCTVAEIHPQKKTVRLELDGEDVGWLTMPAPARIGEVVEVIAYGRHASGKLREARLLRRRADKNTNLDEVKP
jgi:hypothetical protein